MKSNKVFLPFILIILACFSLGCSSFQDITPQLSPSDKITPPASGCYIGAFVGTVEASYIEQFEKKIGRNLAVVMWYVSFTESFPASSCNLVSNRGSLPFITWEPWRYIASDESYSLDKITNGNFDTYLNNWAKDCATFGKPVFLRFAHEMNGSWYPWDGFHNGQNAQAYISAWRHVYDIFSAQGAKNVTWVWCPNVDSVPAESWNNLTNYYPGDEYVDWIGFDGYNWGTDATSGWRSFDSIFSSNYNLFKSTIPKKPIMIGEFACSENGGSKADWLTDAFLKIKENYQSMQLFNWFNINKETNWLIDSSLTAETSAKNALQDTYFTGTISN